LTVSSLPALAFTSLAMFRHPNIPRNPIQRGGLTRLQSLLHVTARQVCSPCIGQDFYARAFTPFVAIGSVEYDYTGIQSMTHRLEGGGSCNGLEVLIPAKAGMMIPAPSGLQEVDGLNRLL
jgi:hypothetical protein